MKKILLIAGSSVLLFSGCKEIGPPINLSAATSVDSTWVMTTVPSTDLHNVLVEEFSGQSCANCPTGHAAVLAAEASNPGHVNTIVIYPTGVPQAVPPAGSHYDFRDSFGYELPKQVTGGAIGGLPSAFIDRIVFSGNSSAEIDGSATWNGLITGRTSVADSLNLAITSSYNAATMTATITATVVYTQQMNTKQNLNIVVVEDSMVDKQEDGINIDTAYLFTGVFRDVITSGAVGDPILDTMAAKVPGRAYKRTYSYKLRSYESTVIPAHFRVIAYVNSVAGNQIMQSAQTKLTGP